MLKAILVGFLVAVLAVFAVGPVEGQTRTERDAFANLERVVRAVQSDSSPRRLADVRRAIERVHSAFQAGDQSRKSADLSLHAAQGGEENLTRGGQHAARRYAEQVGVRADTRTTEALWRSHSRAGAAHMRHCVATVAAIVDAADALEGLVPRFIGYNVRNSSALLSLASAKLEAIRVQGTVLSNVGRLESGTGGGEDWYGVVDRPLLGLVNAAVAVADGLASYREAREVAAEIEASRAPLSPPSPAPAVEAPAVEAPAVEEVEVVTLADWEAAVLRAMGDAESAARAVRAAAFYEDAHPHHERGNAATSRVLSLLNNGFRGLRPVDARGAFMREHGVSWRTINAMLAECPGKPRR